MTNERSRAVVQRHRRAAWWAGVLFATHQIGEALVPIVIGATIDRAIEPSDTGALVRWIAALVVTFAFLSLSWRFGSRLAEIAEAGVDHDLRMELTRRLVNPRGLGGPRRHRGDLLSLASSDTQGAAWGSIVPAHTVAAVAALAVACVALFAMSVVLGLLVVLGSAVLLAATKAVSGPVERRAAEAQQRAAEAGAVAADMVVGMRVIHGLGAEHEAAERYAEASRTLLGAMLASARVGSAIDAATTAMTGAFLAVVALAGARLAEDGSITVGQLVAAFGLAQFLIGPWDRLRLAVTVAAQARASRNRIDAVLGAPPATVGLVAGLRLGAAPGELLAVFTTDPGDGDALAAAFAGRPGVLVAPRRADVFGGDLVDNVARVAADPSRVGPAVGAALLDDVLEGVAHSGGAVAERGLTLSGGQRQRVALARALAAAGEQLVLIEPTTTVDAVTEAEIARRVRALRRAWATIVVTTSPAWLAAADRVVLVDGGRQVATGSHRELLATLPSYAERVAR